jgi:hypothetical protein
MTFEVFAAVKMSMLVFWVVIAKYMQAFRRNILPPSEDEHSGVCSYQSTWRCNPEDQDGEEI